MQNYLTQLLRDIQFAKNNISTTIVESDISEFDWLSPEEDERLAPKKSLEEWTGIRKEMLPPVEKLNSTQLSKLLKALKELLSDNNCHFVTQIKVPELIEYRTIRGMWKQEHAMMKWHLNFFDFCKKNTKFGECHLGEQYCHCSFFKDLLSQFENSDECDL